MLFASKEDLKEESSAIGLAGISQLSSIRVLSKMGIPLQGMIALKQLIDEIECMLWSLLPMGLEPKHADQFKDQTECITKSVEQFVNAAQHMRDFIKVVKNDGE